ELPLGDAVGIAPRDRAKERMAGEVLVEVIEAEDDVGGLPGFIGDLDLGDDAAVVGDLGGDRSVAQRVEIDGLAVLGLAESGSGDAHGEWFRVFGLGLGLRSDIGFGLCAGVHLSLVVLLGPGLGIIGGLRMLLA